MTHPTRLIQALLSLAALAFLSGCQTYQEKSQDFVSETRSGNFFAAVNSINEKAKDNEGTRDELIWRLEQGSTLHSAGLAGLGQVPSPSNPKVLATTEDPEALRRHYFEASVVAFDRAEAIVNHYGEGPDVKVGSEAAALLTTQANIPYRGQSYDKVMLQVYKALAYLQLGDKDKARVELNRSLERQRQAVAENERRIAEAQEASKLSKEGKLKDESGKSTSYDADKTLKNERAQTSLNNALSQSLSDKLKPYGDYVNPFAVFLDGLFFGSVGVDGSDLERARKSFERVSAIVPENAFLKEDFDALAQNKRLSGVTYVLFETGTGPWRDQLRIDLPTFIVADRLAYVGVAFPLLKYNEDYVHHLAATAAGKTYHTALVASMDAIVANDFQNEWPVIVTKTLITAGTKAVLQYIVQKQLEDQGGSLGNLIGAIGMSALNYSTNIADTRTWTSLPKEFQYARFPTPPDGKVDMDIGITKRQIQLKAGAVNVIYVKATSLYAPPFVSQFTLQP